MPYTPGDFSPSVIGDTIIKEAQMLSGTGRSVAELNIPIVAGAAILGHQDPSIQELYSGQECISAKIAALRGSSAVLAATNALSCDIPANNQIGSESLDVTKKLLTNPVFLSIKEKECSQAFTWEERLAFTKLKAKILLEVALTKKLVTEMNLAADVPLTTWFKKTTGTVVGNGFNVTTANWKPEIYADALYAAQINDINSPIMINGSNFYHDTFLQQFKGIACCDNQGVLTGAPWSVYFDLRNVDQTLGGDHTFVLDKNALLFWSSPVFMPTPKEMVNDTIAWCEPLPRLKYMANGQMNDIWVDIRAQKICVNNGTDLQWNYEFTLRGALEKNLADYNGKQGVIKIKQVAS